MPRHTPTEVRRTIEMSTTNNTAELGSCEGCTINAAHVNTSLTPKLLKTTKMLSAWRFHGCMSVKTARHQFKQ